MKKTRVIVTGAAGRMGQAVMKGVLEDKECSLVGAVDVAHEGTDVGSLIGYENIGVKVGPSLERTIEETQPDVMVDFTIADSARENIKIALESYVYPVIGTTGLAEDDWENIHSLCESNSIGAFFAPNFAIGAVLMMECAKKIAHYMPSAEIVELHHDKKIDAPSGTALKTAEMISQERKQADCSDNGSYEKVEGARGGRHKDINIHSVRLPGLVAHQEVIFGGLGQTLRIKHDSLSRESFIPGVLIAVKEAPKQRGVIVGLENLINM